MLFHESAFSDSFVPAMNAWLFRLEKSGKVEKEVSLFLRLRMERFSLFLPPTYTYHDQERSSIESVIKAEITSIKRE